MEENRAFFAPEFKFRIINEDINRSDCQCIVRELNQAANFQEEEDGKLIREYVGGCTLIKNSCEKPDYIINTAAPYYEMEDEDSLLENCYLSCLEIANENHIHSIAFPLLSTGTHGYPIYEAVPVAFFAARKWRYTHWNSPMEVVFCYEEQIAFDMMCLHLKVWQKLYAGFLSEYLPECRMKVVRQDITNLECECIVNSANTKLAVSGGLNGVIHRAAGSALQEECQKLNGCRIGEAKITRGYHLKAKYVIHTVGPAYGTPDAEELLKKCYYNCLEVARENDIHSIAFPMISTGKFDFPKAAAAKIAFTSVFDWQKKNYCYNMEIVFCCFEPDSFDFISRHLHNWKYNDENRRNETQGLVFHCQKLQFYPEDEKLMAEMSVRERIEYRRKLKDMGRYIVLDEK